MSCRPLFSVAVCAGVGVEMARRGHGRDLQRQPAGDHRREAGEPVGERIGRRRVGDRALEAVLEVAELAVEMVRLERGRAGRREAGVGRDRMQCAEVRRLLEHRGLERMGGNPGRDERVLVGGGERRDRHLRRRERRLERGVEREALERVVARPDDVEIAAEPAGAEGRVGRADLPVVARGEVRLVVVDVADRRDHRDLALVVQRRDPVRGRVPAQAAVLGVGRAGRLRERDVRPQRVVHRVARREEHREAVDPAREVDDDEHVRRAASRRRLRSRSRTPVRTASRPRRSRARARRCARRSRAA